MLTRLRVALLSAARSDPSLRLAAQIDSFAPLQRSSLWTSVPSQLSPHAVMRSSTLVLSLLLVCFVSLTSAFICPDGKTVCPERSTCCVGSDGFYDCCPVYYAQCCSGGSTCCPPGYSCSYDGSSCVTDLTKHVLQQTVGAPAAAAADAKPTAAAPTVAPVQPALASIPAVRRQAPAIAHE